METNFFEQFENYLKKPALFYENKLRTIELFQLLNIELRNSEVKISSKLEGTLFFEELKFDFYIELMRIIYHSNFGNIQRTNEDINKLFGKLLKIKKYHRAIEAVELLKSNNVYSKRFDAYLEYSNFHLGNVEKSKKYSESILKKVDFNEITNNYNIYLQNSFVLENYLLKREVYSLEVILEALIRSITVITLDDLFLKSLSRLALDINSEKIATSLVCVLESQGKTFGINLDELRSVQYDKNENEETVTEKTVHEYRYPLFENYKNEVSTDCALDRYEQAKLCRDNNDYLAALSLYREMMDESDLDEELYKNLTYEIAVCYEKMSELSTAKKLYQHIHRRYPGFRLVKERLSSFE